MTWLLKLYPPGWQRRYGKEIAELIAAQRFSLGGAVDLMAGAVDAWLHPELAASAHDNVKGDAAMIARMMHLTCAGYGPHVTKSDALKAAAVMIGGSLGLVLIWLWATWRFGSNAVVYAALPMTYLFPYLLGLRFTSLKGRSARTQTVLIASLGIGLTVFQLLVWWVSTKI